jgi:hypothetical protein
MAKARSPSPQNGLEPRKAGPGADPWVAGILSFRYAASTFVAADSRGPCIFAQTASCQRWLNSVATT